MRRLQKGSLHSPNTKSSSCSSVPSKDAEGHCAVPVSQDPVLNQDGKQVQACIYLQPSLPFPQWVEVQDCPSPLIRRCHNPKAQANAELAARVRVHLMRLNWSHQENRKPEAVRLYNIERLEITQPGKVVLKAEILHTIHFLHQQDWSTRLRTAHVVNQHALPPRHVLRRAVSPQDLHGLH